MVYKLVYIIEQLLYIKDNVVKFELEAIESNFINLT